MYNLLQHDVRISEYTSSNLRYLENNELEVKWKEVIVAKLHILYRYLPTANEGNTKVSVRRLQCRVKSENVTYLTHS